MNINLPSTIPMNKPAEPVALRVQVGFKWSCYPGLNRRPRPYQGRALPRISAPQPLGITGFLLFIQSKNRVLTTILTTTGMNLDITGWCSLPYDLPMPCLVSSIMGSPLNSWRNSWTTLGSSQDKDAVKPLII